jgi:hypothetical protein
MSSIYKNGNKWYYQNLINVNGRKQRFQRSLGTSDNDEATKLQMHYDYIIEYEKRNTFDEKREYISQFITEYLEYREKQVKRRLIALRTLDSDKGALLNFQRYIKHRFGDIKVKRIHRKDFEDHKEYRLEKDLKILCLMKR